MQEQENVSYHVWKQYLIRVTAKTLAFEKPMKHKGRKYLPFLGELVALLCTFKVTTALSSGQSRYAKSLGSFKNAGERYQVNWCRSYPKKACWNQKLFFMLLIQSMFLLCGDQNFCFGLSWAPVDPLRSPIRVTGVHRTSKKTLGRGSFRESFRPQ